MGGEILVWVLLFVLVALGLFFWSAARDREVAKEQRVKHPPAPEVVDVASTPAVTAPPVVRVEIRFGQVFWPAVCAQLFLGTIAWILWEIGK